MAERIPARRLLHPVDFLALGFGSGLLPVAPGTAGTVAAIPVYLLLQPLAAPYYVALVALLALAGVAICGQTASRLGVHDHPGIVWDEIVGYLVTMSFAPPGWISCCSGCSISSSPGPSSGVTGRSAAAWVSCWTICWPGCCPQVCCNCW